jgi:hypothetical protein
VGFQPGLAGLFAGRSNRQDARWPSQAGCLTSEGSRYFEAGFLVEVFEELFAAEHGVNAMLVAGVAVERQRLLQ